MAKKADSVAAEAPKEEVKAVETPVEEVKEAPAEAEEKFAKAGKKSKKHVEEVKAEEERQARKAETKKAEKEAAEKPKGEAPKVRPLIERRGKKYQEAYKKIDRTKAYSLEEALKLAVETNPAKFDATVEAHVRLGVDPRQADQNIRTTVVLPNGNGKTVKVAVFAPLDEAKKAKAAGADIADDVEFLKQLDKGEINFDVLISTPAYMPKLGKYARVLGPKGLMPNPKAGTVTTDIEKAVKEAKAGKVEYRVDKQSIVHIGLGKTNFDQKALLENATVFFDSLKAQKPASIKGSFVKSVYITTTMGPSIQVENNYN
jgi:large subunit ribosomal protein L1